MNIEVQSTPDKNVVNFFPDKPLTKQGTADFFDRKSLHKSSLAENIFDIGDIATIFITPDMISVTKCDQADWNNLKPLIMAEIMDYLSITDEDMDAETSVDSEHDPIQAIRALLNARIRPAVQKDGGDIKFIDFSNGIVTVEMQGSCKGCPYALRTLKDGVEKILKQYIPEVTEVRCPELTK